MLVCDGCDKELVKDSEYIKSSQGYRYCDRCVEESTVTYYAVGGEYVGDDEDTSYYFGLEEEEEQLVRAIADKKCNIERCKRTAETAMDMREFYLGYCDRYSDQLKELEKELEEVRKELEEEEDNIE